MKNRIRKYEDLHRYSALSEVMLNLKKKGYTDKLQKIFLTIYQNEKLGDDLYSEKLKDGIKLVVNGLLEEIFKENITENVSAPSTPVFEPSRTPVQLKVPNSLSRNSPSSHTPSQMKPSLSQKQSVYTLLLRNENELASFSEFNTITGPSTFGRAKREISLEKRNNSPGPAAYIADPLMMKQNSPKIVIPKAGKRIDFVNNLGNPAPNSYYPSKRFISKR